MNGLMGSFLVLICIMVHPNYIQPFSQVVNLTHPCLGTTEGVSFILTGKTIMTPIKLWDMCAFKCSTAVLVYHCSCYFPVTRCCYPTDYNHVVVKIMADDG